MNTTTSLITGGAGFIGSHVAKHCIALGHRVIVLDDLSGGYEENIPPDAEFIHGSILDRVVIDQIFARNTITHVYHLAAYAAEGLSHFIRRYNYHTNLIGSINLINASVLHDVRCFVFTSSIAVYGQGQLPMTEDTQPKPEDPYGISKYAVELDLQSALHQFGLPYIIFRPHNVYGPHQNLGDPYRNVIGIFMRQLLQGNPLTIFGDGNQRRAFSHIDDVAPYISNSVNIKNAYNQVFNIGADVPYTINNLVDEVSRVMNIEPQVQYLPARNEVLDAWADHSKAHRLLGASNKVTLHEGLTQMAEWAMVAGCKKSRLFNEIEIAKSMPPSWFNLLKENIQ